GPLPITAQARREADEVELTVDIPRSEPDAVRAAFPDVSLNQPVDVHAHAQGRLPNIALDARGHVGNAEVTAKGELLLLTGHAFKVDVDTSHVDARAFGTDVSTDLSGRVHAEGLLDPSTGGSAGGRPTAAVAESGGPVGSFRVTTTPGTVADQRIPAAVIEGRLEGHQVTATVRASEPGVDAGGTIQFDMPTKVASFDVQGRSNSLRALERMPNVASGAASARVQGKV